MRALIFFILVFLFANTANAWTPAKDPKVGLYVGLSTGFLPGVVRLALGPYEFGLLSLINNPAFGGLKIFRKGYVYAGFGGGLALAGPAPVAVGAIGASAQTWNWLALRAEVTVLGAYNGGSHTILSVGATFNF